MRLEMAGEAESRLPHGAAEREAGLRQGAEADDMLGSSPGREDEEEPRVSSSSHSQSAALASSASFRSSAAWSSSSSSSLASDVESDDGDATYPRTQCEYEEIPSFRWIATPLRWWKTKKGSDLSRKKNADAQATSRGEERGTPGGSRVVEARKRLVHFDGYRVFTLEDLLRADAELLGKSTNWTVYKAVLEDGNQVVVRRLRMVESAKDFVAEVNVLGKIRHPNLLAPRAYHYSPEGEKFLVFDYMPKGSLSDFLHARGHGTPIDWPTRMNIAIGVTRALHHLHTHGKMVLGHLNSTNILLDYHFNAKIGDYGLSKLLNPAANSKLMETTWASGYHAPELSKLQKANTKTDVYSLGLIMLELLTGKSPDGLDLTRWIASITKVEMTAQREFRDTLKLALECVGPSPDERPEVHKVLQQLEGIKSNMARIMHPATTKGENKPIDQLPATAGTVTTAAPATEERTVSPFEDFGVRTSETCKNLANDGNLLQAYTTETIISLPLACHASGTLPTPINSCKDKDEACECEIPNPTQAEEITRNHSVNEELDAPNPAEDRTEESMGTERTGMFSEGTGASPLSSIDWAKVAIEVHLEVPTSPPLINSDPDSGYQRYFQTLYDLAHRSPPLPSTVLEMQLNKMIMGLHSLGYPLDTWVKAANLMLVLAKKREYIARHVDDYKIHVELRLKEFTSAITPVEEEITRTQSDIIALEQKQGALDETIAKLENQLALFKAQRQEVTSSLTTARDELAVVEARVESMHVNMNCLNQQYSAISDLRSAMLLELPSLDEVFDSNFQEIMSRKF